MTGLRFSTDNKIQQTESYKASILLSGFVFALSNLSVFWSTFSRRHALLTQLVHHATNLRSEGVTESATGGNVLVFVPRQVTLELGYFLASLNQHIHAWSAFLLFKVLLRKYLSLLKKTFHQRRSEPLFMGMKMREARIYLKFHAFRKSCSLVGLQKCYSLACLTDIFYVLAAYCTGRTNTHTNAH